MKKFVSTILLASVIAIMLPTVMQADTDMAPDAPPKAGYQVLANQISARYAVKASTVKRIISCESNWDADAHRLTKRENSYGLVQINLKAHSDVSVQQATDPEFAIDYLASNLARGHASMWTCAR